MINKGIKRSCLVFALNLSTLNRFGKKHFGNREQKRTIEMIRIPKVFVFTAAPIHEVLAFAGMTEVETIEA